VLYGRVEGRRAARKGEPGRRSANTSGSGTKRWDSFHSRRKPLGRARLTRQRTWDTSGILARTETFSEPWEAIEGYGGC
jgi:hypothetical protein